MKPGKLVPSMTDAPVQALMDAWRQTVAQSPRFASESFLHNAHFETYARQWVHQLVSAVTKHDLTELTAEAVDPYLKLWHDMLGEQKRNGFSTKDAAMMVFSLKAALMEHPVTAPWGGGLARLLDVFGLLTFELYAAEKEHQILRQNDQIEYLQSVHMAGSMNELVSASPGMRSLLHVLSLVANKDVTLLLEGESGTGKDVVANLIHQTSHRNGKPLVVVNCGAIPRELVESELFGHEKGAFTGAHQQKLGKFELADGGTLFLDEVGELDLDIQVRLLRVLQNREIERVGGTEKIHVDVRVIAATNRDLKKAVDQKQFRLDLYYRLSVFPLVIPPLRERKEDIIPLAHLFLKKYAPLFGSQATGFSADAQAYLVAQPWPGNIRELENVIQRATLLARGPVITATLLQFQPGRSDEWLPALAAPPPEREILSLDELERQAILSALEKTGNNVAKTAHILGVSRTTLYNKLKTYHLSVEEGADHE